MSVHTIFVPTGSSVREVWETIQRGDTVSASGKNQKGDGRWYNVDENGKIIPELRDSGKWSV